jgi:hypothetical protein
VAHVALRWATRFFLSKHPQKQDLPYFYSRKKIPYKSTIFHNAEGVAHNLIHIMCAEVHSHAIPENARDGPPAVRFFCAWEK